MNNEIKQPIFGNWYIDEKIGSGAFGTVYRIKRESFGKTYYSALKVINIPQDEGEIKTLKSELGDESSVSDYYTNFVQDFAKEIETMAALKGNSNIVSFEDHDFIQHEDGIGWTILIRMELLKPFVEYQLENSLSNHDIVNIGIDLCSALETCEAKRIIHRDIKPDNIFVADDGKFELGDFGIARELEKTTGGLSKKGTYSYMAPEVYLGKPYNNTVDIYSLGIVMYKLLNRNRAPFMPEYPNPITFTDRENALQKRMKGEEIPDIKDIPKALNDIVKKACAFDPKKRYQSASELKQALIEAVEADAPTVNGDKAEPEVIEATGSFAEKTEATAGPFSSVIEEKIDKKPPVVEQITPEKTEATVGPSFGEIPEVNQSDNAEPKKKIKSKLPMIVAVAIVALAIVIPIIVSKVSPSVNDTIENDTYSDTANEEAEVQEEQVSSANTVTLTDARDGSNYSFDLPITYSELKNMLDLHDHYWEESPETYDNSEEDILEGSELGFAITSGENTYDNYNVSLEVFSNNASAKVKEGSVCKIGIFAEKEGSYDCSFEELNGLSIGMTSSEVENTIEYDTSDVEEVDGQKWTYYYVNSNYYFVIYDKHGKAINIEYYVAH